MFVVESVLDRETTTEFLEDRKDLCEVESFLTEDIYIGESFTETKSLHQIVFYHYQLENKKRTYKNRTEINIPYTGYKYYWSSFVFTPELKYKFMYFLKHALENRIMFKLCDVRRILLVYGCSGTGKSLFARGTIQKASIRIGRKMKLKEIICKKKLDIKWIPNRERDTIYLLENIEKTENIQEVMEIIGKKNCIFVITSRQREKKLEEMAGILIDLNQIGRYEKKALIDAIIKEMIRAKILEDDVETLVYEKTLEEISHLFDPMNGKDIKKSMFDIYYNYLFDTHYTTTTGDSCMSLCSYMSQIPLYRKKSDVESRTRTHA